MGGFRWLQLTVRQAVLEEALEARQQMFQWGERMFENGTPTPAEVAQLIGNLILRVRGWRVWGWGVPRPAAATAPFVLPTRSNPQDRTCFLL
jgi:hypothetical protein